MEGLREAPAAGRNWHCCRQHGNDVMMIMTVYSRVKSCVVERVFQNGTKKEINKSPKSKE
jgi:hypothetical protein